MSSYFRSLCCALRPYKVRGGVPRMKSLRGMDVKTITEVMDKCSTSNLDETISACCKILTKPKKLSEEQNLAIMRCLFDIINHREVTHHQVLQVSDAVDYILTNPGHFSKVNRMAVSLDIALAKWIPTTVCSRIIILFGTPSIPSEDVFWALESLICFHGKSTIHLILTTIIPLMITANTKREKYWLARVLELVARDLSSCMNTSLNSFVYQGYSTCKRYYLEEIISMDSAERKLCEQALITLGEMASLLPEAQLDLELHWVTEEIGRVQCGSDIYTDFYEFDLIKPLGLFVKAATNKRCIGLEAALPAVLAVLHHMICVPTNKDPEVRNAAVKISKSLFLSLGRDHSSAVFTYIRDSLVTSDLYSRIQTVKLLHDLLEEADFESGSWQEAVFVALEDKDHKVILEVLNIIDLLISRGCCDKNGNNVIDYLLKNGSQPITAKEYGDEEDNIRYQSFVLIKKIALRKKERNEVFWELKGADPEVWSDLCQLVFSAGKKTSEFQNFSRTTDEGPDSSSDNINTKKNESFNVISLQATDIRQSGEPTATSILESPLVPKSSALSESRESWLASNPSKVCFDTKILCNGQDEALSKNQD